MRTWRWGGLRRYVSIVPYSGEDNGRATGYFSWRLWTWMGWTWISDGDAGRFWHHGNTLELIFFWRWHHRNNLDLDFFWCWHHMTILKVLIWNILESQVNAVVEYLSNLLCVLRIILLVCQNCTAWWRSLDRSIAEEKGLPSQEKIVKQIAPARSSAL